MIRSLSLSLAVTLTGLMGCASTGKAVHVQGPTGDVVRLAGEWEGSYEGKESHRVGTIVFDLGAGRHSAEGQVFMYMSNDKTGTPARLKIRFVSVADNKISGKIAPYEDPRCKCQVETEFVGSLNGDVIDGTYRTRLGPKQIEQTGHWSVYRRD